jgi:hypothetical protein
VQASDAEQLLNSDKIPECPEKLGEEELEKVIVALDRRAKSYGAAGKRDILAEGQCLLVLREKRQKQGKRDWQKYVPMKLKLSARHVNRLIAEYEKSLDEPEYREPKRKWNRSAYESEHVEELHVSMKIPGDWRGSIDKERLCEEFLSKLNALLIKEGQLQEAPAVAAA